MLSASAPTPPPPPPVRTDIRALEPDEQWKADLRKRIEHGLIDMVESAKITRDAILSSQPTESGRENAERGYVESMNAIRTLAQDQFTRELRREMSERKWALDVVDSNSPDVARQQQWILDSIRKTDEENVPSLPPDAPQNAEGALSAIPQQQSDSDRGPDESSEDGYGTGGLEDDEDDEDELGESADEEGEDEEDADERDPEPRQSRPPSRPNVPLTQSLHSKSPVSRRNAPSRQRQPPNLQPPEDNEDYDADDPHRHPPWQHESQPYSPGGAPRRQSSGSQAPVWRPAPRAPEPSGISRTFAHANGQVFAGPIQFPRRGSVNSTGSTSSGAGLHRAGSINSDQHRSSSVAPHGGTERPSTQNRDRIVSNIAPRERQTSASASPHDRPSPPSYSTPPRAIPVARPSLDEAVRFPTSASPGSRAIYGLQRSPEEMRQGITIPRGPTTPEEGPRGTSWSSLNSRRSFGDFNVHRRHNSKGEQRLPPVDGDLTDESDDVVGHLDDRQSVRSVRSVRSTMSIEQLTAWWETEARRKEEEATRKEEEASRKEEEAHRLEEKARQSLKEAERLEAGARKAEASAKMREAAAQNKEAEVKRKEAEAKKREADAQKREAEVQRKEEKARDRELEARRKEEQARRREEEAQRKEDDARKREEEVRRKEDDARKREDDARRREEDARLREMVARQKEEDARRYEEEARKKEEEARKKEDDAKRKEEEARRRKDEAKRIEEDYERRKREIEQREDELRKWEAELSRKEVARLAQEEGTRRVSDSPRLELEEAAREVKDTARLEAEETTQADASNRTAEEAESTAPEQEKQPKARRKGSKVQTKRQKDKGLEERRQKELEEQQRLEEQRYLEEQRHLEEQQHLEEKRRKEEQIRIDEELSRQEQARLDREALLERERIITEAQEREANRLLEEQRRAAEEERHKLLEEQRRKVDEKSRQRDEHRQQQQQYQDENLRQRARDEQQKEFERREAQYYQRTLERERQNSMGASFEPWGPHRPGSTTGSAGDRSSASSTFSSSAGSTWSSSRPSSMNSSHTTNTSYTSSSIPFSTTPKASPTGVRPGAPGTSPHASKLDETEWARRAEERARQQQEQFKREQERLENERLAKSTKVLNREEIIQVYDSHANKWRRLKDSDNLGWNSFAWPVFKHPFEPEEMTTSMISAYVLNKYAPDANSKSFKDRIKDHLKRWHPDKFDTRILPRVLEEEREKVKTGAGVVVRGLNELLNRNYED